MTERSLNLLLKIIQRKQAEGYDVASLIESYGNLTVKEKNTLYSALGIEHIFTLEELKVAKKDELNHMCNEAIVNGFTVTLSDGNEHYFKLDATDQLAMLLMSTEVAKGTPQIPWHENDAEGQCTMDCKYYSLADAAIIVTKAQATITYHQTYVNSLKVWVDNVEDANVLDHIQYGVDIPMEFQSEVLKDILSQM